MASLRRGTRRDGSTYVQVLYRLNGTQSSTSFEDVASATKFQKLVDKFGYHSWMFEASDPPVFKWYLKTFGKDVNLFIDHSQIVEFNAWRLGLWGDNDIWKGKRLSYLGPA